MHASHPLFPAGRSRSRGDLQTGRSSPAAGLCPSSSCRGNSSPASLPPAFQTTSASSARLHGTSQDPRLPEVCHFYSLQRWCPTNNKLKFGVCKDISAHQSCIYIILNTVLTVIMWIFLFKITFLFEYIFKCNLFLWSKLNFQHHHTSLQCHMILQNSF